MALPMLRLCSDTAPFHLPGASGSSSVHASSLLSAPFMLRLSPDTAPCARSSILRLCSVSCKRLLSSFIYASFDLPVYASFMLHFNQGRGKGRGVGDNTSPSVAKRSPTSTSSSSGRCLPPMRPRTSSGSGGTGRPGNDVCRDAAALAAM